ncbi:hypothetical protein [Opitutus terrae]|uniref:CBM-cenC domain-containing protein n=1 Tax=Opitutus terrae (strain DSM 11246 / JCM 15787 / PB90-1) TaxID=452637 RepID=B1ZNQ6_OPITP|nr:hypothetical protein [Opitutus terrae]ACB75426.1 hypothetical protein Oter_2143 [Opitutus terrae PB90-1]
MRSPVTLVFLLLMSATAVLGAEAVPAGWFLWPAVEPQDGSALDASELNARPAGSLGRVEVRDGHFVTEQGGALRFWGANLSSNENFPDAATAERLARRMAKGGINIVRLHHLDNNWSVQSRGSLWSPDDPRRIQIDPQQLDKLHRLVAELKRQGIYSNVNLKVSRTFSTADGFPESIAQTPTFNKRVDYFQRRMIELQKDYARQLLGTKNPYTGLSLAEDPAVAIVEINNENSLLGLRTRDVGRDLEKLPEPFRGELTQLWNTWLAKRYPGVEALAAAWQQGATPSGKSALTGDSRWHADAQPGNQVDLLSNPNDQSSVHFRAALSDRVRWRAAAYLDRLNLTDRATYTVTFAARADAARPVQVTLGRDEPGWRTDKWRTRGLYATIDLKPEWQEFRFVVNAHSVVDVGSRFSVTAGHQPGEVWVKNLRIYSGAAQIGLRPGQSPADGTVPIPVGATPAQWGDWLAFLVDTEVSYVAEMRQYLRDELHVRVPIVCTQANYGGIAGLARERASEFIDAHAYWQHPDFGGWNNAYDLGNFTIINTPQVAEFSPRWAGEIGGIALLRVSGKPFSVTEIDNPAPSDFACEMYPLLAGFGSVQDWDAIYPFDIVGLGAEEEGGPIRTFFDQNHHPVKWGFAPFATRSFRQHLIPVAQAARELFVRAPVWQEADHVDVAWLRAQPGEDLGFLTTRLSVSERLLGSGEKTHVVRSAAGVTPATMTQTPRGAVFLAQAPQAAAIVGYVGGGSAEAGALAIASDEFGLNFAALTAVALDGRALPDADRLLVTLGARAENQAVKWNAVRTSIGESWGHGPTIAERVPATVRLRVGAGAAPRVFALAPDGSHAAEVPSEVRDGWLSFSTREGPATLHYEIVR